LEIHIGGGPNRIILGFMLVTSFLSMWISNTATTIMMIPIALAIILQMEEVYSRGDTRTFSTALMLGIAYAASAGGIATLVGTPPNLSFARIFEIMFPAAEPIAFGTWFLMGLPITVVMLGIIWIILTRGFFRIPKSITVDQGVIDAECGKLGKASFEEKAVFIVFITAALLWVFRKPLNLGFAVVPGWSQFLPRPELIDDGTVALLMAMLLFLVPAKRRKPGPSSAEAATSPTVMPPGIVLKLPWNIILLFGGGFALARGFQATGLAAWIGGQFAAFQDTAPLGVTALICSMMTFVTELTSNTATTEMALPILASIAVAMKTNPLLLMVPATLSASCAFMMPVATPPNAIIFGSGRVRIADMVRAGLAVNLIGIVVITTLFYALGTVVFGIDPARFPEWAAI